jgi:hypothetical protein
MDNLHVWKIRDGETHWCVATSLEDAIEVLRENSILDDYDSGAAYLKQEDPTIVQLADDEPLGFVCEGEREERLCGAWAQELGRNLLASTVW